MAMCPVYRAQTESKMQDATTPSFCVTPDHVSFTSADLKAFEYLLRGYNITVTNDTQCCDLWRAWSFCQLDPKIFIENLRPALPELTFPQVAHLYASVVETSTPDTLFTRTFLCDMAKQHDKFLTE